MENRVIKGVSWSALERFSVQAVQFIVSMVLARLLTPEVFGHVALALVILNILQTINEIGFGAALMQKITRDELDYSSVFVLNILLGVILYSLLFILAPYMSHVFNNDTLTSTIRWIGLNLIITSLVVVQRTKLLIAVDFKTMAKASLIASLTSGVISIYCAYRNMGVMALVIQSLLNNFLVTLFIWLFVKWRPKLQFSWERFKSLYLFAYKLILSRLMNVVFNEVYSVVIGVFYAPAQLGLFNRAKSFEYLSTGNITAIVQRVSIPLLCEQQNDKELMRNTLLQFISNTAFLVYPLLFGLAVLSKPLIQVLLTEKWIGAVWILQILCLVGLFYVSSTFNRNVFNATGRTDWALKSEFIKKIIAIILIIFAIQGGFRILVWSQVVIAIIEFVIDIYYTKKQIGLDMSKQIIHLLPILIASLSMGIVVFVITLYITLPLLKLIIGTFAGGLFYLLICWCFNICNTKIMIRRKISDA